MTTEELVQTYEERLRKLAEVVGTELALMVVGANRLAQIIRDRNPQFTGELNVALQVFSNEVAQACEMLNFRKIKVEGTA